VRFATYNIQFGFGLDGAYDLDRVAEAVADADIVCMQEVTTHWRACNHDHQPERIARLLNRFVVFGAGYELDSSDTDDQGRVVNTRRGFGNLVLSRWPVTYSRMHSLPRPVDVEVPDRKTDLPRCALEAVIDAPGLELRVISVHLSHQSRLQRMGQVAALRELLVSLPVESSLWKLPKASDDPWAEGAPAPPVRVPTLVGGDFNFEPGDPEYAAMLAPSDELEIADAWIAAGVAGERAKTCVESDGSLTTLDYVFMSADLVDAVTGASVRSDRDGSDHFPLIVDLDSGKPD
jgi:endonuclease/exonuclease/phosphatase family metal-dependent hydrolase